MKTRLLFLAVITPLGVLGRARWRRRLGLAPEPRAETYWRRRADGAVTAADLRRAS